MEEFKTVRITRMRGAVSEETDDVVAIEKKVRISVNGTYVLSLYCSPVMVREFVVGVIHNEGLIEGEWCAERLSIDYGDEINVDIPAEGKAAAGEKIITSGCAGGVSMARTFPGAPILDESVFPADGIRTVFRDFQKLSEGYHLTGGVHSAALTDGERLVAFAEDIGRHNAVDKIIGYCILENIPFAGSIMLASGRLSSEIVLKCSRSGVPVLVSRAAPTSLALDIAASTGVTVIGFVRGDRMNVYTGRQRIRL